MRVFLGLGSNLGKRRENLEKALVAIDSLPWTKVEAVSDFVESEACGQWMEGEKGGTFTNCCARIRTLIPPHRLLGRLKMIERSMGRNEQVKDWRQERKYSDRVIDIDILLYGQFRINTEELQIPHPHMQERDFVMTPLKQIIK